MSGPRRVNFLDIITSEALPFSRRNSREQKSRRPAPPDPTDQPRREDIERVSPQGRHRIDHDAFAAVAD
jgi:hypothetical protein